MARILNKPDGYFHGRITILLAPVAALLAAGMYLAACLVFRADFNDAWIAAVAGLGGCLMGLVIDPDLDQENMTSSSEHRMKKALAVLPGVGLVVWGIWMGWWSIYGALHKHRGTSHWPVIGTLVRVLWLSPIWYAMYQLHLWAAIPLAVPLCAFIGLAISDFGHWARDYWK